MKGGFLGVAGAAIAGGALVWVAMTAQLPPPAPAPTAVPTRVARPTRVATVAPTAIPTAFASPTPSGVRVRAEELILRAGDLGAGWTLSTFPGLNRRWDNLVSTAASGDFEWFNPGGTSPDGLLGVSSYVEVARDPEGGPDIFQHGAAVKHEHGYRPTFGPRMGDEADAWIKEMSPLMHDASARTRIGNAVLEVDVSGRPGSATPERAALFLGMLAARIQRP